MEKRESSTGLLENAVIILGKVLELQGRPACRNKDCRNFLTHSPKEIRKYGVRQNKSTGEEVQRYECLVCHKKFAGEDIDLFTPEIKNKNVYKKLREELTERLSYADIAEIENLDVKTVAEITDLLIGRFAGNMMEAELFFDGEMEFLEIPITTNKFKATTFISFPPTSSRIETIFTIEDTPEGRSAYITHCLQKFKDVGKELKIHSPYTYAGTTPFHMGGPDESKEDGPFSRWIHQYTERILIIEPEAFDSIEAKTKELKTVIKKIREKKEKELSKVSIGQLKDEVSFRISRQILDDMRAKKEITAEHIEKILDTIHIPKKQLEEINKIMPLSPEVISEVEKIVVRFPHLIKSWKESSLIGGDRYCSFLKSCHDLEFLKWTKAKTIQELRDRLLLFSLVYNNRKKKEGKIASQKLNDYLNMNKTPSK